MTNSATCQKGRDNPGSVDLCDFHEVCLLLLLFTPLLSHNSSLETWPTRARKSHSTRHMDSRRCNGLRPSARYLSVFHSPPNGKPSLHLLQILCICVCLDQIEEDVTIAAFRRYRDLLLSLFAGPKSRGASIEGDVERFYSCL